MAWGFTGAAAGCAVFGALEGGTVLPLGMEQQDFLEPDGHSHSAVQPKMRDHKMIGMRVAICRKSRLCIQLMRMVSLNGA